VELKEIPQKLIPSKRSAEKLNKNEGGILGGFSSLWKKSRPAAESKENEEPDAKPRIPNDYLEKRRIELIFGSNKE
jgi:hypothetical protein